MNRGLKISLSALVLLAVALLSLSSGLLIAQYIRPELPALPSALRPSQPAGDVIIDQVRDVIDREALNPSSDGSQTTAAINGMLKTLNDPYAAYFDAKHYQYFQQETDGQFGGIGITISVKDGTATVVSVIKDTPAARAGIKGGDRIVTIDGVTRVWASDDVISRIRGKDGTKVTVKMRRDKVSGLLTFSLTRAVIAFPNVTSETTGSVGYIRLGSFNAKAEDEVRAAVKELDAKGAKGYVIDLRENPGGLLSSGVAVASLFIKSGPIVRVDERGKPEDVQNATGRFLTDKPLVVLVDENSASAAEIFAGAMQDYRRATVVGTKSFGKGSVQTVKPLSNGGALKLTIAHYLTPSRRVINGKGVVPDLIIPMGPQKQAQQSTDVQLQQALDVLRQKLR